jgi:serine/threonine protein kinase
MSVEPQAEDLAGDLPSAPDPLVGSQIDRRYNIERVHGRGGMAVVYAGVHRELGLSVAIKVLDGALASDPEVVRLFLAEARTARLLSHPNIVAIFDLGCLPDGRPFLVMPMLTGSDLATLLLREGPQPPKRVARLLEGVGAALDLIHEKGLVHRDIKSENLIHVPTNRGPDNVIVLDFGIASARMPQMRQQQVDWCGTPEFMPPEALAGETSDHRGDVYALATVAFELLAGSLPFDGRDLGDLIQRKIHERPRSLSQVTGAECPAALEAVLARGLASDPEQRPSSAGELVNELTAAAALAGDEKLASSPAARRAVRRTLVGTGSVLEVLTSAQQSAPSGIRPRRKTRLGISDFEPDSGVKAVPPSPTPKAATSPVKKPVAQRPKPAPARARGEKPANPKLVAPAALGTHLHDSILPAVAATDTSSSRAEAVATRPLGSIEELSVATARELAPTSESAQAYDEAQASMAPPADPGPETVSPVQPYAGPPADDLGWPREEPSGARWIETPSVVRPSLAFDDSFEDHAFASRRFPPWLLYAGLATAALVAFFVWGRARPAAVGAPEAQLKTPIADTPSAPTPAVAPSAPEPSPTTSTAAKPEPTSGAILAATAPAPQNAAPTPPTAPSRLAASTPASPPPERERSTQQARKTSPAKVASKPSVRRAPDPAPPVLSIRRRESEPEPPRPAPAKSTPVPAPAASHAARAEGLTHDATDAMLRGELQPAAALYDQALRADASYAPAWRGKGLLLERTGRQREAAAAFKEFLRLQPNGAVSEAIARRLQALEAAH